MRAVAVALSLTVALEPAAGPVPPTDGARTPEQLIEGFESAEEAVFACAAEHAAAPGTMVTVEATIEASGQVVTANVSGPSRSTPLGRCVAEAVKSKAEFAQAGAPLQIERFAYRTSPAIAPPATNEPAVKPPVAAAKVCLREDFEDFDAFVDCQTASLPDATPKAAPRPAQPPSDGRTEMEREAAEVAGLPNRRDREYQEALRLHGRRRATSLALMATGGGLTVTGGILWAVGGAGRISGGGSSGPQCTVGKRCGNTCIEISDVCHIDGGGSDDPVVVRKNEALVWSGVALVVAGVGLAIGGFVVALRNPEPRRPLRFGLNSNGPFVHF